MGGGALTGGALTGGALTGAGNLFVACGGLDAWMATAVVLAEVSGCDGEAESASGCDVDKPGAASGCHGGGSGGDGGCDAGGPGGQSPELAQEAGCNRTSSWTGPATPGAL